MPERLRVPGPEEVRDLEEPEMGEERVREELVAISMRVFWARMMGELMVAEPVEILQQVAQVELQQPHPFRATTAATTHQMQVLVQAVVEELVR